MKNQEHKHFLHPHPLQHTNTPPKLPNPTCSACKLTLLQRNYYHKCQTCPNFYLHQICYNMPQVAHHKSDPGHIFTLRPTPPSSASLDCNACTNKINTFYYDCSKCRKYYHILCLASPVSVRAPSHSHILSLQFSPPYEFRCDICQKPSCQGWLYRCEMCEFDVHFACAINTKIAALHRGKVPLASDDMENKRRELMELLRCGVNRIGEKTDYLTVLDGSNAGVEERSFLSGQLSDACFSIDFAKSLLGNETMDDGSEIREAEGLRLNEVNNAEGFKNGIGSHVWKQLDPESEKRYAHDGSRKDSNRSNDVRSGCSCWSNILMRN